MGSSNGGWKFLPPMAVIVAATTKTRYGIAVCAGVKTDSAAVVGAGRRHLPWSHYDDLRSSLVFGDDGGAHHPSLDVVSVRSTDPVTGAEETADLRHLVSFLPIVETDGGGSGGGGGGGAGAGAGGGGGAGGGAGGAEVESDVVYNTNIEEALSTLLALRHFNDRVDDVVPELAAVRERCRVKLTMDIIDTRLSPIVASRAYLDDVLPRGKGPAVVEEPVGKEETRRGLPHPTALLGASRSAVSAPLAILSGIHQMPQVSYASTATTFNNKDQFPFFGRTIPCALGDANAAVSYLSQRLGVTHLGVLFVRDEYGSAYAQVLQYAAELASSSHSNNGTRTTKTPPLQIGVTSSFSFGADRLEISAAVRQLADSDLRYFFGIFFRVHASAVLSEAYRQGIAGPGYYWIFSDSMSGSYVFDEETESDAIRAMSGSAMVTIAHPSTRRGGPEYNAFVTHWTDLIQSEEARAYVVSKLPLEGTSLYHAKEEDGGGAAGAITNKSEGGGDGPQKAKQTWTTTKTIRVRDLEWSKVPGPFSMLAYDSVIAVGMAACSAAEKDTYFDGTDFYKSFLNTTFSGISGTVAIEPETGNRLFNSVPYSLSNFAAGLPDENGMVILEAKATDVQESCDGRDGGGSSTGPNAAFCWTSITPFVFSDGTTDPPLVIPDLVKYVDTIETGAQTFSYVLSSIIVALSVAFAMWTFLNRDNVVVRSSQPTFLGTLCLGALLVGLAIIPMAMQDDISKRSLGGEPACMLTPWLFSLGFIVAFSGLFSKTMLVNKFFPSRGRQRVAVKARDVLRPLAFLFVANIAVLTSWTAISPLTYRYVPTGSVDKFGRENKFYATCDSAYSGSYNTVFVALWSAINVSALLYANYHAYRGRYIITEYGESFYIGISMAILLQAVIIGTPVMFVVEDSPTARCVVRCCLVFITSMALLLPIFVPKMIFLRRWRVHEKRMQRKFILSLKKERQMDALAFGDMPAESWYLRRMEESRAEVGRSDNDGDIRIIAESLFASMQTSGGAAPPRDSVDWRHKGTEKDASIVSIRRRLSLEDRSSHMDTKRRSASFKAIA